MSTIRHPAKRHAKPREDMADLGAAIYLMSRELDQMAEQCDRLEVWIARAAAEIEARHNDPAPAS